MKVVHGAEDARATLLRRQPLGETELPEAVRRKNAELFGAEMPVDQQVRRIIPRLQVKDLSKDNAKKAGHRQGPHQGPTDAQERPLITMPDIVKN